MANLDDYIFMKEKKHKFIRIIWFLFYVALVLLTIGLVSTLRQEFLNNPTITTLDSPYHPVNKIPFPGVAICNMNKVSKKRAMRFAKSVAPKMGMNVEKIFNLTKLFGKLHDFEYSVDDRSDMQILEKIVQKLDLNLITILTELTTDCDSLLERCYWIGVEVNCSKIFQMRSTYDGYCCAFNYVKKIRHAQFRNSSATRTTPLKGEVGMTRGLSVVVNNDVEDYLYAPMNSQGVTVQIFSPTDFPDKPSGSLSELIAVVDTENFLRVVPTTIWTVQDVMNHPVEKRGCLFDKERPTTFDGKYSQSDCNVNCRINSAIALCQCIPFMIPFSTKDNVCTFNNLPCLSQYKNKWYTLYPEDDTSEFLDREKHDSLRCSQKCYPSCDGTSYEVFSDRASNHNKKNSTVIHVYYGRRFSDLYKHDVVYYWFDILSNYGGTFGIIIGLSILSVIECVIYSLQTIRKHFDRTDTPNPKISKKTENLKKAKPEFLVLHF